MPINTSRPLNTGLFYYSSPLINILLRQVYVRGIFSKEDLNNLECTLINF